MVTRLVFPSVHGTEGHAGQSVVAFPTRTVCVECLEWALLRQPSTSTAAFAASALLGALDEGWSLDTTRVVEGCAGRVLAALIQAGLAAADEHCESLRTLTTQGIHLICFPPGEGAERRAPNNVVGALAVDMLCAAMASCETALQLEVCAEALLGILREAQGFELSRSLSERLFSDEEACAKLLTLTQSPSRRMALSDVLSLHLYLWTSMASADDVGPLTSTESLRTWPATGLVVQSVLAAVAAVTDEAALAAGDDLRPSLALASRAIALLAGEGAITAAALSTPGPRAPAFSFLGVDFPRAPGPPAGCGGAVMRTIKCALTRGLEEARRDAAAALASLTRSKSPAFCRLAVEDWDVVEYLLDVMAAPQSTQVAGTAFHHALDAVVQLSEACPQATVARLERGVLAVAQALRQSWLVGDLGASAKVCGLLAQAIVDLPAASSAQVVSVLREVYPLADISGSAVQDIRLSEGSAQVAAGVAGVMERIVSGSALPKLLAQGHQSTFRSLSELVEAILSAAAKVPAPGNLCGVLESSCSLFAVTVRALCQLLLASGGHGPAPLAGGEHGRGRERGARSALDRAVLWHDSAPAGFASSNAGRQYGAHDAAFSLLTLAVKGAAASVVPAVEKAASVCSPAIVVQCFESVSCGAVLLHDLRRIVAPARAFQTSQCPLPATGTCQHMGTFPHSATDNDVFSLEMELLEALCCSGWSSLYFSFASTSVGGLQTSRPFPADSFVGSQSNVLAWPAEGQLRWTLDGWRAVCLAAGHAVPVGEDPAALWDAAEVAGLTHRASWLEILGGLTGEARAGFQTCSGVVGANSGSTDGDRARIQASLTCVCCSVLCMTLRSSQEAMESLSAAVPWGRALEHAVATSQNIMAHANEAVEHVAPSILAGMTVASTLELWREAAAVVGEHEMPLVAAVDFQRALMLHEDVMQTLLRIRPDLAAWLVCHSTHLDSLGPSFLTAACRLHVTRGPGNLVETPPPANCPPCRRGITSFVLSLMEEVDVALGAGTLNTSAATTLLQDIVQSSAPVEGQRADLQVACELISTLCDLRTVTGTPLTRQGDIVKAVLSHWCFGASPGLLRHVTSLMSAASVGRADISVHLNGPDTRAASVFLLSACRDQFLELAWESVEEHFDRHVVKHSEALCWTLAEAKNFLAALSIALGGAVPHSGGPCGLGGYANVAEEGLRLASAAVGCVGVRCYMGLPSVRRAGLTTTDRPAPHISTVFGLERSPVAAEPAASLTEDRWGSDVATLAVECAQVLVTLELRGARERVAGQVAVESVLSLEPGHEQRTSKSAEMPKQQTIPKRRRLAKSRSQAAAESQTKVFESARPDSISAVLAAAIHLGGLVLMGTASSMSAVGGTGVPPTAGSAHASGQDRAAREERAGLVEAMQRTCSVLGKHSASCDRAVLYGAACAAVTEGQGGHLASKPMAVELIFKHGMSEDLMEDLCAAIMVESLAWTDKGQAFRVMQEPKFDEHDSAQSIISWLPFLGEAHSWRTPSEAVDPAKESGEQLSWRSWLSQVVPVLSASSWRRPAVPESALSSQSSLISLLRRGLRAAGGAWDLNDLCSTLLALAALRHACAVRRTAPSGGCV